MSKNPRLNLLWMPFTHLLMPCIIYIPINVPRKATKHQNKGTINIANLFGILRYQEIASLKRVQIWQIMTERIFTTITYWMCHLLVNNKIKLFWIISLTKSLIDLAGSVVKFDRQGDGLARYDILNYQRLKNSSGFQYKVSFD